MTKDRHSRFGEAPPGFEPGNNGFANSGHTEFKRFTVPKHPKTTPKSRLLDTR